MTYLAVHHLINMFYPALLNLIVQIVYLFFQQQDLSECDTQSIGSLLIFAQKQCCKTAMQIGANLNKALPTCLRTVLSSLAQWRAFQITCDQRVLKFLVYDIY